MGGIGSDPNYNPHGGYGSSDFDVGAVGASVISGLGSAFGALGQVASKVTSAVQDEGTKRQLADVTSSVTSTAGSFWGSLSAGATNFVNTVTQPDGAGGDFESDGLADLQRQFHSQRSVNPNSKYSGFGSDSVMNSMGGGGVAPVAAAAAPSMAMPTSTLGEAIPGPGEDPNGIERLSGESDDQYVMRQTRLRDEAKARMAAKFGGGGMIGVGSNGGGGGMSNSYSTPAAPSMSAPSSGNMNLTPGRSQGRTSAPSSGNVTKMKVSSGDDFFASFGN